MYISCVDGSVILCCLQSGDKLLLSVSEVGKKPPVFAEASFVAQEILDSGFQFDLGEMYYNHFR